MIKLFKNVDPSQPVSFKNIHTMKDTIAKDRFSFDGLTVFRDGEPVVILRHVDRKIWEVEETGSCSEDMSFHEALDAFADAVISNAELE